MKGGRDEELIINTLVFLAAAGAVAIVAGAAYIIYTLIN